MNKAVFATLTFAIAAIAQPLAYTLLPGSDGGPSPRFDGAIAYDPVGKQAFVFGGQDAQGVRNDLWRYSFGTSSWTVLSPVGLPPQARFGHTVVFDTARRRLIVFAGQSGGFFSDVWAYDVAGDAWQQLARDNAGPSRRYGHSAIYDVARDRMVISHGFTDAGRFDDTWAFDFKTNAWTNLSPAQNRPLRRCLHHAAYDAANGQMYLYGGCSSGFGPCPQADLWSFDLARNTWTELTPKPSPAGRQHYGMAFDATRAMLVVFGGTGNGALNDTWEYDPKLRSWRPAELAGPPPSARNRHEAAFATDSGAVLFFGGSAAAGLSNDLWSLSPVKPPLKPVISAIVNSFSLSGGAIAPGELVTIQGSRLGPDAVSVIINGIAAPLVSVSEAELRLQVPYEVEGSGTASVVVTALGSTSEAFVVPVAPVKPGVLMSIANEDGSLNTADNPAVTGSVVSLRLTGYGVTIPPTPTGAKPSSDGAQPEPAAATAVTIGDRDAPVISRALSTEELGVVVLKVRIPEDYLTDPAARVIVSVAGETTGAQPVKLAVMGAVNAALAGPRP